MHRFKIPTLRWLSASLALAVGLSLSPVHADSDFFPLTRVEPSRPAPDLVIRDMEFVIVQSDEFKQMRLRVHVKNIGDAPAIAYPFPTLEIYRSAWINNTNMFERIALWAVPNLNPGAELVYESNALGVPNTWIGYYLAVVDRGTSFDPRGVVHEGPTIMAEKNNTMGIPSR
ncbi:hypothetical protein KZZ07_06745 [Mameliella sp. CS4]|uniref:hypothetical protein n=1 Tax=Mameliella sp. CS4 TaxID=2862329 RepID=UPI001C5EB4AC|nr:hypothetical protein [Mameliella sp. CS4]MBW4982239.1 hypothetical protein [Mameliella sp. CS4]